MFKLFAASLLIALTGCATQSTTTPVTSTPHPFPESTPSVDGLVGDYATIDYGRRSAGYDWVGVTVEKVSDQEAYVAIRSRGDKKRPTCTFDGVGQMLEPNVLAIEVNEQALLLTLRDNTLTVSAQDETDENLLFFYCSGGASLAGPYQKLDAPLDTAQLSDDGFEKVLSLQEVTFTISATAGGALNTLTIRPEGLQVDNRLAFHRIDGNVVDAEIEDLNADGWPEVLVYIQSAGSGSYGSLIGYSVNNGKSMSPIALPDLTEALSEGYMGHDEFTVIETSLARRFPVYREGDSNAEPTGPMRQIQYKLVEGEAMRQFIVVQATDIDL